MKYWLRYPGRSGFVGPLTLDEIRERLGSGSLKWECEVIQARGQSLAALKQCRIWQPLESICPRGSVAPPDDGETWLSLGHYQTPSEKALAEIRFASAYSNVRGTLGVIENLLILGLFIMLVIAILLGKGDGGEALFFWFLIWAINAVIIYCVFYLIKNILITLLDISDLQIDEKLRRDSPTSDTSTQIHP